MIEELISNYSFNCRICLWTFENELELNIHNYLEHMIINHAEHMKIVEDGYTSSREIVEEFEQGMYSNGYGTTVSAFTPEQIAHLIHVTIDRLHYIIDEYMKGYDKTGNLGFLELASETRVDLQRITRQVEELCSYGYDIELTK